jgi:hypothetical protein
VAAVPAIDPPLDPRDPYAYTYGELTEEELRVQPTYPTIQPPSTGEPVPANRPTAETAPMEQLAQKEAVQEQTAQEQGSPDQSSPDQGTAEIATDTKNTAVEDADKTIESATHNG